ncbi:MAG: hypothetical protein K0U36_05935 [Alphaproteobacteria bacterium]|nr:hypothetical protein [Alphaproteobacteria bacterium]
MFSIPSFGHPEKGQRSPGAASMIAGGGVHDRRGVINASREPSCQSSRDADPSLHFAPQGLSLAGNMNASAISNCDEAAPQRSFDAVAMISPPSSLRTGTRK